MMPSRSEPRSDDPRLPALAAALRMDLFAAFGRVVAVLEWARGGPSDPLTSAAVDGVADCVGFAAALEAAGYLSVDEDGVAIADVDGRTARRRARDRVRAQRYRDSRPDLSSVSVAPTVTKRDAATNEKEQINTPRAALPPHDPLRRVIRSRSDAFHMPHLEPSAKMVVDHFAQGIGQPHLDKQAAVILVMDLLDRGVDQSMLLHASAAYEETLRQGGTPEPAASFFAPEGMWREFAESRG